MLLGVAALAGNLGPALVGILDPGLRPLTVTPKIALPIGFCCLRRWKQHWNPLALDLLCSPSFCSSELPLDGQ